MSFSVRKSVAIAMISAVLPLAAHAGTNDVVTDKRGNVVRNTFGNCVLTKWMSDADKCGGEAVPVAYKNKSRSYLVFFDFDRSDLTEQAKDVLSRAYSDARNQSSVMYDLVGHADRSGSDAYNMSLSKRRAVAVQSYLSGLGLDTGNTRVSAKGESVPLVNTEDGVKEPQNRRVEVNYNY